MKHFQINIKLLFFMVICFDTGIVRCRPKRRNLSSLMNSGGSSASPVVTPAAKSIVTPPVQVVPPVVTTIPKKPTTVVSPVKPVVLSAPSNRHKKNYSSLLSGLAAQQTNPDRLAALQILNDAQLTRAYHQDLMAIDLLLLDTSSQMFQNNNVQAPIKHTKLNFSSLVQVIAPPSKSGSAIRHLSNLIGLIQDHTTVTSSGGVQKKHIILSSLIKDAPVTGTVTKKSKNDLLGLITASASPGPVSYRRKRNLSGWGG